MAAVPPPGTCACAQPGDAVDARSLSVFFQVRGHGVDRTRLLGHLLGVWDRFGVCND